MTRRDFLLIANAINHRWNAERIAALDALELVGSPNITQHMVGLTKQKRHQDCLAILGTLADDFAVALYGTNPRFDRERFLAHC